MQCVCWYCVVFTSSGTCVSECVCARPLSPVTPVLPPCPCVLSSSPPSHSNALGNPLRTPRSQFPATVLAVSPAPKVAGWISKRLDPSSPTEFGPCHQKLAAFFAGKRAQQTAVEDQRRRAAQSISPNKG